MNNDLFKNGDLLRSVVDMKFYVISDGMRRHISRMTELFRDHLGKKVNKVSEEVLSLYPLANEQKNFVHRTTELVNFSN